MQTHERISYGHELFVDREHEYNQVSTCFNAITAKWPGESRVLILTGERGTGKSWFLEEVAYRMRNDEHQPVLVYKINLQENKNQDPYAALDKVLQGFYTFVGGEKELGHIPSETSRLVMEQLQSRITETHQALVVLVDHVYESDWNLIEIFEDYLFAPLAVQPNTFIIMTGRGRRFQWHTPELISAPEIHLQPFEEIQHTREQIVRLFPDQEARIKEIHRMGGGYPLCNLILAQHSGVNGFREIVDFYLEVVPEERRDLIDRVLKTLCVLRSFDEYRLQAMLSKAEPALAKQKLDPHSLIQELQHYGFASWLEAAQAYKLDRAIQMAIFGDLRIHNTKRCITLHRIAREMYYSWVRKHPESLRRWQVDICHHESDPYNTARATRDLIGRVKMSVEVQKVIYQENSTRIIYIEGNGGIGKTFFLRQMLIKLEENQKKTAAPVLQAANLIDLYQTQNHSADGLTNAIYQQLAKTVEERGLDAAKIFEHYLEMRAAYETAITSHYHQGDAKQTLPKMRQALIDDINTLAQQYRIVIFFDTLEFLLIENPATPLLDENYVPGVESYVWMCNEFLPKLTNTVVLVAGRPQPGLSSKPFSSLPEGMLYYEKLQGLDREEFDEYLSAIARAVGQQEIRDVAAEYLIQMLSIDDERRIFESLCEFDAQGNSLGVRPILFSLVIDHLVLSGGQLPAAIINYPLDKNISAEERKKIRRQLEKELITSLYQYNRPADELIFFLACARKEVNLEMLARQLNLVHEDGKFDLKLAMLQLESVLNLSFVKYRPDQQQIVLHDEMYEMFRTYVLDLKKNQPRLKKFYDVVNAYYTDRIQAARDEIENLFRAEPDPGVRFLSSVQGHGFEDSQKEILTRRQALQSAIVDYLHYQLRQDLEEGFNIYFRYADEAALNDDDTLDLLLQAELFSVFRDEENHAIKTQKTDRLAEVRRLYNLLVKPDAAVRYVKRQWQEKAPNAQHKAAYAADQLREGKAADLLSSGDALSQLEFASWDGLVLARRNRYDEAIQKLDNVVLKLNQMMDAGSPSDRMWSILARAYNNAAFVSRKQGKIIKAHNMYHEALNYWRMLNMQAEQANTLNNLAYVECLQGEFDSALQHAEDARDIRLQQGSLPQVVLSWSTLAEINTYAGKYKEAYDAGNTALKLATINGYQFGEGLACLGMAGIFRYRSEPDKSEPDKKPFELLSQAKSYAEHALEIFDSEKDPESRVRALYEMGVIQRELYRFKRDTHETNSEYFQGSENYLNQAINKAQSYNLWVLYADALLGLGWLYYYAGQTQQMNELLQHFDEQISGEEWKDYKITPEYLPVDCDDLILGMFAQLARREAMSGRIMLDEYEEGGRKTADLLQCAAQYFTRAFHYYSIISENYRDIRRANALLYTRFSKYSVQELMKIFEGIPNLHEMDHKKTVFWKMMEENFGRYETLKRLALSVTLPANRR